MSVIVVSPSLVEQGDHADGRGYPLNHARIGYQTLTRNAVVTASSEAPAFPASATANPMTYERWRPAAVPAWVAYDAGEAVEVDYLGIASHNLGTAGATFALEYSVNGTDWTTVETVEAADDLTIMLLFEPITARYWRLSVTEAVASVGVVYIGRVLEMQRGLYGGHTPGNLARQTEIMPNKSDGGQFLGRSIIREGYATSYEWDNLTAGWYRQWFDPFVESARKYPFFIAWYPLKYPSEVLYAWCNDDIRPRNQGVRDLMSVGFSVEAIA
ncbi:hypothetical protein CAL18_12380 [Bordetella genomosp. 7]|uniref:discoidin domain-containing protein n=1 Tax=Bordetella genomosp. 7 TaxID=1416805 RepID=UPI000B9DEA45|nr:discoidin domain-containing protein [Bordetella genomosp. 7]OZI21717.1 hypothetical protein CAL18_12380 [Bordetella genomosp. 7]